MTLENSIAGMVAEAGRLTDAVHTKLDAINAAVGGATQNIAQKWQEERDKTLARAAKQTVILDVDAGDDAADGAAAPVRTTGRLAQILEAAYPTELTVVFRSRAGIVIDRGLILRAGKYVYIDLTQSGGVRFASAELLDGAGAYAGTGIHSLEIEAPAAFIYGSVQPGRPRVSLAVPASVAGPGDAWTFNARRCALRMSGDWWPLRMDLTMLGCDVAVGPQSVLLGYKTGTNTGYNQRPADMRFSSFDSSFALAATGQKTVGWTDLDA